MDALTPRYLFQYRKQMRVKLRAYLDALLYRGTTNDLMRVYESAVYSSQVEGSKVTLIEFTTTLEAAGGRTKPRDIQEVEDLVTAYRFAQANSLNTQNLLEAHRILSRSLVHANDQGTWRTKPVKVGNTLVTVYMAPHQQLVPGLMAELMEALHRFDDRTLDDEQIFYYASLLHLQFVKIHPFIDGNGRTARLLEKWFLASQLGDFAWRIRSEKYIINHRDEYYETLGRLGDQWGTLDWGQCVPFLLLLPRSLKNK